MNVQRPLTAAFVHYGETITITRSGAAQPPQQGFCAPMDNSTTGVYFDANEAVGLLKPALILYLDATTATVPVTGDIFFRDGRTWTVRKIHFFRISNTIVLILALCD